MTDTSGTISTLTSSSHPAKRLCSDSDGSPRDVAQDVVARTVQGPSGSPRGSTELCDQLAAGGIYDPYHYICTGYDIGDYRWFSGLADEEDQRFLTELKDGTMDKLPDVRPFLYHIGFFHGDRSSLAENVAVTSAAAVEGFFVVAGRRYLLKEKEAGSSGYFLAPRNWEESNRGGCETMPYAVCVGSPPIEGDVGFSLGHGDCQEDGLAGGLMKTNLRVPLPLRHVTKLRPGDANWDEFIRWLYQCQNHPAISLVDCYWSVAFIHHRRVLEDLCGGQVYFTEEADDYYPSGY